MTRPTRALVFVCLLVALSAGPIAASPRLEGPVVDGPAASISDLGPRFRPLDLTDQAAFRARLDALAEAGVRYPEPVRREAPPLPVDRQDIVLLEADMCNQGCINYEVQYQQGYPFFGMDQGEVVRRAIAQTGDDYDVVIIWTTFFNYTFGGAFYAPIANEVRGINGDQSGAFPSETYNRGPQLYGGRRLRGLIDMHVWYQCDVWNSFGLPCDLDPPFRENFFTPYATLAQEVGHQWGAFVEVARGNRKGLLGRDDSHWSYYMDSDGSPMEGNDWIDNGDGSFTVNPDQRTMTTAYNDLDLYLMGLMPPEEVQNWFVIVGPDPRVDVATPPWPTEGQQGAGPGTVTGKKMVYTIQDVIDAEGERVPTAAESEKLHRELWVLVHLPIDDANPTNQERDTSANVERRLQDLEKFRRHWNEMFYRITDHRMRAITTASGRDDYPYWTFKISPEGWEANDPSKVSLRNEDDSLVLEAGIADPGIVNQAVKIDTEAYPTLTVSFSVPEGAEGPAFFSWSDEVSAGFPPENNVALPIVADGRTHTYVVDLSAVPEWTGLADGLRLVLSSQIPEANSKFTVSLVSLSTDEIEDKDGDLHPDFDDNCVDVANPGNADADGDGIGDACEPDTDGDGVIDDLDVCPEDAKDVCQAAQASGGGCGCAAASGDALASGGLAGLFFALFTVVRRRR